MNKIIALLSVLPGFKKLWVKPENLEIERRWIIKHLPDLKFDDLLHITQYYTPWGRFRKSYNGSVFTYYHTVKNRISVGVNEEIEETISKDDYENAIKQATSIITKHRYKYKHNGLVYEFDGMFFKNDNVPTLWVLEIELNNINQPIEMPDFIKNTVIKEITGDKAFSNFTLSTKI
jgi:CYTH domain-containing protein